MTSPRSKAERTSSEAAISPLVTGRLAEAATASLDPASDPLQELVQANLRRAQEPRAELGAAQQGARALGPDEAHLAREPTREEVGDGAHRDELRAGDVQRRGR